MQSAADRQQAEAERMLAIRSAKSYCTTREEAL